MKICINCGVVVKNDAVLFCSECGAGHFQETPRQVPDEALNQADKYYDDVLPEDAGQEQEKQNNTGLYVKIGLVAFVVAIIVSACAVVVFMM